MAVNQVQSLKSFVINHPPLVLFTLCIFLFGVTTVALAYIVGKYDFPNPDVTMDWNIFLSHLTERSLCVHMGNLSDYHKSRTSTNGSVNATVTPEPLVGVEQLSLSELLPDLSSLKSVQPQKGPTINVTKSMVVPINFDTSMLNNVPSVVTWIKGQVTGRHVGFTGQLSKEIIHVNMFLPNNLKKIKKQQTSCKEGGSCDTKLNVCMVFFGSSLVIPKTKQLKGCKHWTDDVNHAANATWYLPDYASKQCSGKTLLKLRYEENPSLTAMLTSIDRSLVNLHLTYTSYLIFIIVITMLCYALVQSHFKSTRIFSEKVNV